jgi:hypothetical protein
MRSIAVAGLALAATLCLATAGPALAGGDGRTYQGDVARNYHGTGLYVHHHSYAPPSIRNVYAVHSPGPYHVHVLQSGGYTYVFDGVQGRYVATAFQRRGSWQWQGGYRRW